MIQTKQLTWKYSYSSLIYDALHSSVSCAHVYQVSMQSLPGLLCSTTCSYLLSNVELQHHLS